MGGSTSESRTTEDSVTSPEKHGAKTKKQSPPGLGPASAPRHSGGRKQKAAAKHREMHSNATKASKRSSGSKASLSRASSRADLVASKSQKTYPAQKGSSAATPSGAASLFPTIDPSPEGYPNQDTPTKPAKDPLWRKSRAHSRESPKDVTPGNISVKPTWKGAENVDRETGHGAGKRRGPSTSHSSAERSRVSRACSKLASPAKKEDKGSPATADKRSLRSRASRTSKRSPSSSRKRSRHRRGKHGGRRGELEGEPDVSGASLSSLAGGSRGSAGSSKRSLRPLEEGSIEEKEQRRKYGEEKVLVMPDGTRVSAAEKNRWIRVMEKEHLGCDCKAWCFKFVVGIVMILVVYIIFIRRDLMTELALILRDSLSAPGNYSKKENDGKNYTTTTASSSHKATFSSPRKRAAKLSGRNQQNSTPEHELGMPL